MFVLFQINMTLCVGAEASVVVAVQQLERYPVDLYYLVDVSASMQDNLDQVSDWLHHLQYSKYLLFI